MRFFLYLLRWFILSNLKEKKTGEMMLVVSIKPLHAFKTHLNFFYETCITFTTKIFFFFFWMSESNLMNYWLNVLHQKLMQIFLQHLINIYSFSLLSVHTNTTLPIWCWFFARMSHRHFLHGAPLCKTPGLALWEHFTRGVLWLKPYLWSALVI